MTVMMIALAMVCSVVSHSNVIDLPAELPLATPSRAAVVQAATAPAAEVKAGPKTAQDWLALAEKKHASIKTLTAKVNWLRIQGLIGDEQRRLGTLHVELGKPAKFAVHFDKLIFGRRSVDQDRSYVFDGKWLVEKIIDVSKKKKQFFKWQVVPPNVKPELVNPMAVGQGPFSVPVPVNKAVINKRFYVKLVTSEKNDKAGLVQLHLKPKAKSGAKFTGMDIWYSRDTLIPTKVRSIDESENESIFVMKDAVVGGSIKPGTFSTTEPSDKGWEVQITPWKK